MSKFFQRRPAVATAACVAVVALMSVSVGTVQAVVAQDQQENEEARERGAQGRLRLVQELRPLARAPRAEIRSLFRVRFGRSLADRVLAMAEKIELTEQQEAQIRDARRAHRRAEIERDAQIDVVDLDLDELLEDRHTADLDAVEELMQRQASLRVQGQVASMRASREVWNALTAEQQEKLEANRHGFLLRRGDGPHSLFFDGEVPDFDFEVGDLNLGELGFGDVEFGSRFSRWTNRSCIAT